MSIQFPTHNKYKNRPTGGYSSRKEAKRAQELKLFEKAGIIRNLQEQVSFVLIPSQIDPRTHEPAERPCKYVADFVYEDMKGVKIVEDVKSPASRTAEYIIKRKLMLKVHAIRIRET